METYAGSGLVRFEYKDFVVLGQDSLRAAEAASCANEQDSFWAYHDTLFLNQQSTFADEDLRTFAAAIDLDEGAFSTCLGSNRYRNEINDGIVQGREEGVEQTPTLRINGQVVEQATFERIQSIINQELTAVE